MTNFWKIGYHKNILFKKSNGGTLQLFLAIARLKSSKIQLLERLEEI